MAARLATGRPGAAGVHDGRGQQEAEVGNAGQAARRGAALVGAVALVYFWFLRGWHLH
jgi:hypothetical protein